MQTYAPYEQTATETARNRQASYVIQSKASNLCRFQFLPQTSKIVLLLSFHKPVKYRFVEFHVVVPHDYGTVALAFQ